jgi:uncharacterized protein YndB with AHSA1/START domain
MQMTRELELDVAADDVWRLLRDPDELAAWVGDEVRGAAVVVGERTVSWTWAPEGVESTVEVTVVEVEERTVVRVVERSAGPVCSMWVADALLHLELRALTWQHRLVGV